MQKIPDISHYHPVSNWRTCKKKYPFMITKATQGTSFTDKTLEGFIAGCEKYHIPYFLYVFLNKGNEVGQCRYMYSETKYLVGPYFRGYVLDVERHKEKGHWVQCTPDGVRKALEYISQKSYKCMIYTMYAEYDKYKSVIKNRPSNCAWWEARYGLNNGSYSPRFPPHAGTDLHQYTSIGKSPGISSAGDLNRLTGKKPLEWFTAGKKAGATARVNKAVKTVKAKAGKYSAKHVYPALPPRGYYTLGDGYKTLDSYTTQIKRVQLLCNYVGYNCGIDGDYGPSTRNAVIKLQKKLGLTPDGKFGHSTLTAAKAKYK